MAADPQAEVLAFLADPATHGGAAIERIDTHISAIFLAGERVFKLKRAVKLPYVDFSTPEARLAACRREVQLNTPTAPGLYLGAQRITREADGRLAFDGKGETIDAAIEMRRFEQSALFDRLALAGELTPALMVDATRAIARFHRGAPIIHAGSGRANLEGVLAINRAGFATSRLFAPSQVAALDAAFRRAVADHAKALDQREREGRVRHCHGDLHLRNLCLSAGHPCLFDCIEFNDTIAEIDVLYDLAFLLMDLAHRGHHDLANLVANRYFDEGETEADFALLPLFMALRAAVRAHVIATQAQHTGPQAACLAAEARSYFALAETLLAPAPARLVAIGGFSGSGKSTVAEALAPRLAPPPGARIIESDRVRKALHGVSAETRLPASAYAPAVSEQVYATMRERIATLLAAGGSVLTDAVFDRKSDREAIERVARRLGLPFRGFWLEVPTEELRRRVAARRGSASDATVGVLDMQLAQPIGRTGWQPIDGGLPLPRILAGLTASLGAESSVALARQTGT